jgi:anthranilate phosphoribosyltransferase
MQELLAKVAKGAKTSKDLTWEEAKRAVGYLIEGQASPTQAGAFLVAMRMKTESVTELAAFTAGARQYVPPLAVPPGIPLVDLPMYAGKLDTFHVSVIAAIVAASAGVSVLMHGAEGPAERPGPSSLLDKLEIPTDQRPADVANTLSSHGFAYLDMALYHPPIGRFLEVRGELGVRTFFHQVARMLNPARATSQLVGVSHPPYYEKTAEALRMLGTPRALVIRGVEGEPELSIASSTPMLELRDERITPLMVKPKDLGVALGTVREMAGFPAEHRVKEAEFAKRLLKGEIRGGPRDWVVINAASLLYAGGKRPSIAACVPIAQQALDSGAAAKKLADLALNHHFSAISN